MLAWNLLGIIRKDFEKTQKIRVRINVDKQMNG